MKRIFLWFEATYKSMVQTLLRVGGAIIALSGIIPSMQSDVGTWMDKIYMGVSPEHRIIIGVTFLFIYFIWTLFDNLSKIKDKELLIKIATKIEGEEKKSNQQNNWGGVNIQDVGVGRDLIIYPDKEEKKIFSEVKVKVSSVNDETEKDYFLKRIQLINQSSEKLLSCYVTAISLNPLSSNEDSIPLASNDMVWANSNSRISDNKVDLVEGIATNLYIARINRKKKDCEIFGINGLHTSIEQGDYILRLRLDGENFESPKAFSVEFYYDGKKSLEFKKLSELSDMVFLYSSVGAGLHKMKFDSK